MQQNTANCPSNFPQKPLLCLGLFPPNQTFPCKSGEPLNLSAAGPSGRPDTKRAPGIPDARSVSDVL